MAIVITNQPEGIVHNAYNHSVIEFEVDAGDPKYATIDISGHQFRLTPDLEGKFWFNLKPAITSLINQNHFSDTIQSTDVNYCLEDETLYLEQEITLTVYLENLTNVTTDVTYIYLKSVIQQVRPLYDQSNLIRVLLPSESNQKYVTYFEGYPFDVSIYSNADRTVTITNLRTSGTLDVALVKGVNRLFLSNGENDNGGFEGDLPLSLGSNQLQIDTGTDKVYLTVKKVPVGCGPLLKWFNQSGGWSYWRILEPVKEIEGTKSLDELVTDYHNMEDGISGRSQSGKEANDGISGFTGFLQEYERLIVKELFKSPKVYFYANEPLQPYAIEDWKEVDVADGNKTTKTPKGGVHEYKIDVEMPLIYTQTL